MLPLLQAIDSAAGHEVATSTKWRKVTLSDLAISYSSSNDVPLTGESVYLHNR